MTNLTQDQIKKINDINTNMQVIVLGEVLQALIDKANMSIEVNTPVNAVSAGKILTIGGVVIDGQTVTINNPAVTGTDVYEFLADTEQTKTTETNIAVNITAHTVKAVGELTITTKPTSGDTMTIGTKVYTFVPVGTATADGEISIGANVAGARTNIIAAINGTDGINVAHTLVKCSTFTVAVAAITALVGGVAGNSVATTSVFTANDNLFTAVLLSTGADCIAANAVIELVAAITASDTQGVGAVDGAGDTVELTADVAGVIGNAIIIGETMVNGTFAGGATLLSGGIDGTVGTIWDQLIDTSYLYVAIANNTISGKNWRRVSLGSAY